MPPEEILQHVFFSMLDCVSRFRDVPDGIVICEAVCGFCISTSDVRSNGFAEETFLFVATGDEADATRLVVGACKFSYREVPMTI